MALPRRGIFSEDFSWVLSKLYFLIHLFCKPFLVSNMLQRIFYFAKTLLPFWFYASFILDRYAKVTASFEWDYVWILVRSILFVLMTSFLLRINVNWMGTQTKYKWFFEIEKYVNYFLVLNILLLLFSRGIRIGFDALQFWYVHIFSFILVSVFAVIQSYALKKI